MIYRFPSSSEYRGISPLLSSVTAWITLCCFLLEGDIFGDYEERSQHYRAFMYMCGVVMDPYEVLYSLLSTNKTPFAFAREYITDVNNLDRIYARMPLHTYDENDYLINPDCIKMRMAECEKRLADIMDYILHGDDGCSMKCKCDTCLHEKDKVNKSSEYAMDMTFMDEVYDTFDANSAKKKDMVLKGKNAKKYAKKYAKKNVVWDSKRMSKTVPVF